jgi:hypothetical protein
MKKLKLDKKGTYSIYRGPTWADIQKEPALFDLVAGPLDAAEAAAFPREEGALLAVVNTAYPKDDKPAGYI